MNMAILHVDNFAVRMNYLANFFRKTQRNKENND